MITLLRITEKLNNFPKRVSGKITNRKRKKLKGFEMGINVMFSIVLAIIVFGVIITAFLTTAGYLGPISQMFCDFNPSWCGELPACVCCETVVHSKMGWPFEDIYSEEYVWTNIEDCRELLRENDGRMWWKETDPNLAKCGNTPNATLTTGIIFKDVCSVPEQYVSDSLQDCVCCQYNVGVGHITVQWDMDWRCVQRDSYNITGNGVCGALWMMPPESQKKTLQRIGKYFGTMGEYCSIPYPYNLTVQP